MCVTAGQLHVDFIRLYVIPKHMCTIRVRAELCKPDKKYNAFHTGSTCLSRCMPLTTQAYVFWPTSNPGFPSESPLQDSFRNATTKGYGYKKDNVAVAL